MSTAFGVTWDYRCPFARNVHEYLVTALEAGADWDVTFLAFSLDQTHVDEGAPSVWEEPAAYPALLANQAGIVVRDRYPDQFLRVHRALFSARHDRAIDLRQRDLLASVLVEAGADAKAIFEHIEDGWPLETFHKEHAAADALDVFGVPTFIIGNRATFVRLLDRPGDDVEGAKATVSRLVGLLTGWPGLNEFKYTNIDR